MLRAKCQKCGHYDWHRFTTCPVCRHVDDDCVKCRGAGQIAAGPTDGGTCGPGETWRGVCPECNGTGKCTTS